ncbi:unnamed protein product [Prorocentrum cordatum]|uniref:RRM domain-containing protein n=1 Tax=Prorocentrum cordatum TaxID=2364126 RepID=A0ABN9W4I4_9DINO|nr:unnamed protein product [Polarella glacialis]
MALHCQGGSWLHSFCAAAFPLVCVTRPATWTPTPTWDHPRSATSQCCLVPWPLLCPYLGGAPRLGIFRGRGGGLHGGIGGGAAPAAALFVATAACHGAILGAVRLRGLPFASCTEQDVLAFFAQNGIVECIVDCENAVSLGTRSQGRPSGHADVLMRSPWDAQVAQQALDGKWMGNRYIEVFVLLADFDGRWQVAATSMAKRGDAAPSMDSPGLGKDGRYIEAGIKRFGCTIWSVPYLQAEPLAGGGSGGPPAAARGGDASGARGGVGAALPPLASWPGGCAAPPPVDGGCCAVPPPVGGGGPAAGRPILADAGSSTAPSPWASLLGAAPPGGAGGRALELSWEAMFDFLGKEAAEAARAAVSEGPSRGAQ